MSQAEPVQWSLSRSAASISVTYFPIGSAAGPKNFSAKSFRRASTSALWSHISRAATYIDGNCGP